MKKLSLLYLFLLLQLLTYAQFKTVAESPLFKEPQSGYVKILQLKNGNTVYFYLSGNGGLDVTIFNKAYKEKIFKHHTPVFGSLKGARINGIFETGDNITLMISEVNERRPTLYRLVINSDSGNLEKDDKIAEANKYLSKDLRIIPEFEPVTAFSVRKDPTSDNYAVFIRKNSDDQTDKNQMEAIFYNGEHQEISRAFYQPTLKYGSFNYLDMAVLGDDRVCILGFAYNQIAVGDLEGTLVMLTLDKGARRLKTDILNLSDNRIADSAIVRFNPVTKKLLLLGAAHIEDADPQPYAGFLAIIDPYKPEIEQEINIYPEKANTRKKELLGAKKEFTGMPQDMVINSDGGFTIFYEELIPVKNVPLDAPAYTHYMLEHLAVAAFDSSGKETYTAFIPRKQYVKNSDFSSFHLASRKTGAQKLIMGDQFKSFAYLSAKDKVYIMFNDTERNNHITDGNITLLRVLANCDAFVYTLDEKNVSPDRSLFFDKSKKKENRTHTLALFNIGDYYSESNTYATLKLQKRGKEKGARIVWMTL
jgi:hypothetical protein